jgi:hypothetical protein
MTRFCSKKKIIPAYLKPPLQIRVTHLQKVMSPNVVDCVFENTSSSINISVRLKGYGCQWTLETIQVKLLCFYFCFTSNYHSGSSASKLCCFWFRVTTVSPVTFGDMTSGKLVWFFFWNKTGSSCCNIIHETGSCHFESH